MGRGPLWGGTHAGRAEGGTTGAGGAPHYAANATRTRRPAARVTARQRQGEEARSHDAGEAGRRRGAERVPSCRGGALRLWGVPGAAADAACSVIEAPELARVPRPVSGKGPALPCFGSLLVASIELSQVVAVKLVSLLILAACCSSVCAEVAFAPFRKPKECIELPLKYGLKPLSGPKPTWKDLGLGWNSQTEVTTHKADIDNDVTCLFSSSSEESIESVKVTANCFNAEGATATLKKFRQVIEGLLKAWNVDRSAEVFAKFDPTEGRKIEGETYVIELQHEKFRTGYGIVFKMTTK